MAPQGGAGPEIGNSKIAADFREFQHWRWDCRPEVTRRMTSLGFGWELGWAHAWGMDGQGHDAWGTQAGAWSARTMHGQWALHGETQGQGHGAWGRQAGEWSVVALHMVITCMGTLSEVPDSPATHARLSIPP